MCHSQQNTLLSDPSIQSEAEKNLFETITQLGNSAILIHLRDNGKHEAVYVSPEYAKMMEDTPENITRFNEAGDFREVIYPDDWPVVQYILENHEAPDKSKEIQIRKITAKNNIIWCKVHYAFLTTGNKNYIYLTFEDITLYKNMETKVRASYDSIGQNFYHHDKLTLGIFRVNLTLDILEEVRGRDLFSSDNNQTVFSEFMNKRARNYINFIERKKLLETFNSDNLIDIYIKGRVTSRQVLLSRRENGNICYVEFAAIMTRNPVTGHIVAFISERECNNSKVYQTIVDKILARQFEMIAYMAIGSYHITVS